MQTDNPTQDEMYWAKLLAYTDKEAPQEQSEHYYGQRLLEDRETFVRVESY